MQFAATFDDFAVLQQKSGGDAWVYGVSAGAAAVTVKVRGTSGAPSVRSRPIGLTVTFSIALLW